MKKETWILFGFIVLKFLLQYAVIDAEYDLQRDEFLHLDQAHHLAWGFSSVPPFTSWISFLIYLLGNSVFWVKFFPALFGALTIYIVWCSIKELDGDLFALILGGTCILFSALLRLNMLYQPNSFDVLSWTTLYFLLIKYFKSENSKWLFYGCIIFALGFLNKYNILFLIIGIFPAILITQQRKIFFEKSFYIALTIGLILIAPNLIWQYVNNFPVVHHLNELTRTQLVHVHRLDFLKNQLLFYTGSLLVIGAGIYALLFYSPFYKYRSFFWAFIFTLIVFLYLRAKDYYAIGLYPVYIAFGSVYISYLFRAGWKRYFQPVLIMMPIIVFIPFYQIAFPNKSPEYITTHKKAYKKLGLLRWEDGRDHDLPQDFADMLGWKELAVKVDSIYNLLPHPETTIILCDNYGQAGAINYYTKRKVVASSFNSDYIDWLPLEDRNTDAVLVKENDDEDKNRQTEIPLFDTVYLAARRINSYAREDTISIYILKGAKVDINERIKAEAIRKQNQ